MARIFISYRSADGADKATALARDLGRVFGDAAVFIDKDDLTGGVRWADEVGRTLQARPLLLLLLTPALLDAGDAADGRRPLDDPDSPVRRELDTALAAGAVVLPLLCDGVDALPAGLPAPLDSLSERTWRRLRTYDWAADVARLQRDLQALGVPPAGRPRARRALTAAAALLLVGGVAVWALRARPPADALSGVWQASFGAEPAMRLHLRREGEAVHAESEPIDIRQRADWADYRSFWEQRFGSPLEAVRLRGEGTARTAAGSPPSLDLGFRMLSVPGDVDIDGGNLTATLAPDGSLAGTRWLNSVQAEVPARLERAADP